MATSQFEWVTLHRTLKISQAVAAYDWIWVNRNLVIYQGQASVPEEPELVDQPHQEGSSRNLLPVPIISGNLNTMNCEYLDLSRSGTGIFPCKVNRLYLRACYPEIYETIAKDTRSCFISGSPGIGKTFFNSYIWCRRMFERKPTTYQADSTRIFCFSSDGAFALTTVQMAQRDHLDDPQTRIFDDPNTWHLIDLNSNLETTPLVYEGKTVIVTTSPGRLRRVKTVRDRALATPVLWMEPPSWSEIWITAQYFGPADVLNIHVHLENIARIFVKWGPIFRDVMSLSDPVLDASHAMRIKHDIARLQSISHSFKSPDLDPALVPHSLFMIVPGSPLASMASANLLS